MVRNRGLVRLYALRIYHAHHTLPINPQREGMLGIPGNSRCLT